MRFALFFLAASAVPLLSPCTAPASPIVVPGTASVWLAEQPNGTVIYTNTAPNESPVLVPLSVFGNPTHLTFAVTGATARGPDPMIVPLVGGDGETPGTGPIADQAWVMPPVFNLSGFTGPYSGLVGVFFTDGPPGPTPPSLNFGTPAARSFVTLSPQLQQVFFIGDGLTGVGTGAVQTFNVPPGATRLYLATYDSISLDNVGALRIEIDAPAATPVPAPSGLVTFVIVLGCFLVGRVGLVCHARHRHSVVSEGREGRTRVSLPYRSVP